MDPNLSLKMALLRRGIRQKHLAQMLRKSEATVSNWVVGHCQPARHEREIISQILNVPEEQLFEDGT